MKRAIVVSALALSLVLISQAQDVATDVAKGTKKTAKVTKAGAKDVAHGTETTAKDTGKGVDKTARVTKDTGRDVGKGTKAVVKDTGKGLKKTADKLK
jgi:uncharacterized membrane protein